MKRAFRDQDSPAMFPNLHHQSPPNFAVNHQLTTTSEEADSKKESNTTTNDGTGLTELARRTRGRPPGSKNKSKSPVSITREPDPCMSPYVLEVSVGSDIITAVTRFCNRRKTGLCVLSGSGIVSNVSFRQPTTPVIFQGRFNLLSISATILPPSSPLSTMLIPSNDSDLLVNFVVSLAGPNGRTFSGAVIGPLIAAGTVHIVAVSFNNPLYHRLPIEEEEDNIRNSAGDGSVSAAIDLAPAGSGGGDSGRHQSEPPPATATVASELLTMYRCHFPANVRWAPAPRQAPPHSSLF